MSDPAATQRSPTGHDSGPGVLAHRYRLGRLLGDGGMAQVYQAFDVELDRHVAIKLLPPDANREPGQVERFRREARAAAALAHPGVVTVYDIGESADRLFVVMEYLDGQTLREVLGQQKSPLPVDVAARIGEQICVALGAAHSRGVIHRDIKPGNIMVGGHGAVKVLDFGIALIAGVGFATETGTVLGTPAYLSPEQAQGHSLDARSDLYSLGCCLYEMTTGHPPFTGATAATLAYRHVNEPPTPPRDITTTVTPKMQHLILRAVAKNPDDRYPSAAAMATALAAVTDGNDTPRDPARGSTAASVVDDAATARFPADTTWVGDEVDAADDTRGERRRRLGLGLILGSLTALLIVVLLVLLQLATT